MDIIIFKEAIGPRAIEYAQDFWTKTLGCAPVYDNYCIEGTFNGGLSQSRRLSVRRYWAKNKWVLLQEVVPYALCLLIYSRAMQCQNKDNYVQNAQTCQIALLAIS